MTYDLSGKTVIVTGGASGIGEAAAVLYAKEGCRVVISDLNEEKGNKLAEQIKQAGGKAIFVRADVSKPTDCEELVRKTVENFGSVDIAFNNAGIGGENNPVADMSIESWDKTIAVNLSSVFYCMKGRDTANAKTRQGVHRKQFIYSRAGRFRKRRGVCRGKTWSSRPNKKRGT